MIDTAAAYNNESGVGAAIRASGIPRDELFVTTKLRNGDQGRQEALRAYDDSLERLGLDFADLYLIHWPSPARDRYVESWQSLEELYAAGRVRAIGVSNFLPEHLDRLMGSAQVLPAVDQIELHPTFQQSELTERLRALDIAIEAYSPLGQAADLDAESIASIAAEHETGAAAVLLSWHLARGHIVIPKSANRDRMRANLDALDLSLSPDSLAAISALEAGNRVGGDPKTLEFSQIR
jgi:diketogulonate reductase-like aldo/keto reductase